LQLPHKPHRKPSREKCESPRVDKANGKKPHLTPLINDSKILDTYLQVLDTYITTKTLWDITYSSSTLHLQGNVMPRVLTFTFKGLLPLPTTDPSIYKAI